MSCINVPNRVWEKAEKGEISTGIFIFSKDSAITEMVADVGLDFVIIDTEHAKMDYEAVERHIMAAQLRGMTPFVRVPEMIPYLMRSYMESGAKGVMVPHITSGEDCKKAQDALRYPPQGSAGSCECNRSCAFTIHNWDTYYKEAENTSLIALIEDYFAMDNLGEILKELKPGRDMIMFGKADYGQSLRKVTDDMEAINKMVNEAYVKVAEECRKTGIVFMATPSEISEKGVSEFVDTGAQSLVLYTDLLVLRTHFDQLYQCCKDVKVKQEDK